MSRRTRRQRPATPQERRQVEEFTELADVALTAGSLAERRHAVNRMRRITDRLSDPGSLANLTARELHDVLAERQQAQP